jgi:catechol 2,3-dioxygenase-like lactoylglutathione lyase family enzyme
VKVTHLMIGVTDMDQSVRFYGDLLGLAVQSQSPELSFLTAGSVTIGLATFLWDAYGKAPGTIEVVFGVDSVRTAHAELEARGVKFFVPPRSIGGPNWAANFADPDGHACSVFGPE